ncbi:MAG: tetratricopeptide repeat protein [Phycisphaerales bacterium]|nr:tetratricopeptide repeat protein [Phycisphaerales bacterium]
MFNLRRFAEPFAILFVATGFNARLKALRAWVALVICGVLLALLPGCSQNSQRVNTAVEYYYIGDYPQAEAELAPLIAKPDNNYVLNNCRYGSAALAAGNLRHAEQAFLTAYRIINSVNSNTAGEAIGAVTVYEGIRVWKGEPFERAMAHYYLGLIYLIKGDYENARAAFQNSLFRLRAYSNPDSQRSQAQRDATVDSNFSLGYFGLGFCYHMLNRPDLAKANFQLAEQLNPAISPVVRKVYQPGTNCLVFVDWGFGPRKRAGGWYGEKVVFGPPLFRAGPPPYAHGWVDHKPADRFAVPTLVDTLALAAQKRWLTMDTIREGKAIAGTAILAGGLAAADYGAVHRDQTVALAGLGAAVLGAAIAASSHADTRYWEMLPRCVYVIPVALKAGDNTIRVAADGTASQSFTVQYSGSGYRVLYVRLR